MHYLLIALLITIGCTQGSCSRAQPEDPRYLTASDGALVRYTNQLTDYGCAPDHRILIGFVPEDKFGPTKPDGSRAVAMCYYWEIAQFDDLGRFLRTLSFKEIHVSQRWWDAHPDWYARMAVVGHENGHCLLGVKPHNDTLDENGCPVSVMHSHIASSSFSQCVFDHHQRYLKQLCLQRK